MGVTMSMDTTKHSNKNVKKQERATYSSSFHSPETGEVFEDQKKTIVLKANIRHEITHFAELKNGERRITTQKKTLRGFEDPYIYSFKKGLRDVALNDQITGQDFRVLFYILSWVGKKNISSLSQAFIGKNLKIKPSNVATSITRLEEQNILIRRKGMKDQNGRTITGFRINANLAWCGRAEECNAAKEEVFLEAIPHYRLKKKTSEESNTKTPITFNAETVKDTGRNSENSKKGARNREIVRAATGLTIDVIVKELARYKRMTRTDLRKAAWELNIPSGTKKQLATWAYETHKIQLDDKQTRQEMMHTLVSKIAKRRDVAARLNAPNGTKKALADWARKEYYIELSMKQTKEEMVFALLDHIIKKQNIENTAQAK
jgi:DNA-binding MarR family transcriptional regulator